MFIVPPFNRVWLGFLFMFLLSWPLCIGAPAQAQSKPQDDPKKGAEIKALLKERQALLKKVLTHMQARYAVGAADFSMVAQAELDALKATLDVVEDPKERIAALQQHQKTAKEIVQLAEEKFKVGASTEVDVLQAKAILLAARIELLREEQKTKPKDKPATKETAPVKDNDPKKDPKPTDK
jgi:hypothetical protein